MTISGEILIGFIVLAFVVSLFLMQKNHNAEKKDLLNRIMAKDYKEFAIFDERSYDKVKRVKMEPVKNLLDAQDVFQVD
jgi:hypothetical protein